ncbi:DUF4328 domain-containing protein [Actinophytocola sp.]|uniref:DUF4328 domain-containing protein n=1 Tax=Actinophytocola sp. TaxID=1872138 RepID=UPI002ED1A528
MPSTVALAPLRQVAVVTGAMVVVTCTAGMLATWSAWHRYEIAVAFVAGEPDIGVADYVGADNTAANTALLWLLAYAVTAVTFLTWSWRTRCNAERLNPVPHRLSRGWTIGGWLVPFFPLIVLEDVWRTSRPNLPSVEHARQLPRAPLVHYWWYTALACVAAGLWLTAIGGGTPTLDEVLTIASATTVLATLQIVAAALVIPLIRQVTQWQTPPSTIHV